MKVIFMEPETPGNIGALARVMNNFDLKDLILINPQCEIDTSETRALAKHAYETVKNARILDELDKISGEIDHLIGSTGIIPDKYSWQRTHLTPKQLKKNTEKVEGEIGVLLGREGKGLTNEELEKCNVVVNVPTSSNYPVMNITHAAAIIIYELREIEDKKRETTGKERETLIKYFNETVDQLEGIKDPEEVKEIFERVLDKSFLQPKESRSLIATFKRVKENL